MSRTPVTAGRARGSPAAAPDLIDRLEDSDQIVAQQAWQALRIITQKNLPLESHAWKEAMGIDDDLF